MPTIQVKSSVALSDAQKTALKQDFGQAIELIPGKSEAWLMVLFGHCEDLYFKGERSDDAALVEVGIKGTASPADFGALGSAITESLAKHADIDPSKTYISYSEFDTYSWNGGLL